MFGVGSVQWGMLVGFSAVVSLLILVISVKAEPVERLYDALFLKGISVQDAPRGTILIDFGASSFLCALLCAHPRFVYHTNNFKKPYKNLIIQIA